MFNATSAHMRNSCLEGSFEKNPQVETREWQIQGHDISKLVLS